MKLPCRHIVASKNHAGESLYDEALCADRWEIKHYKKCHRALNPSIETPNDNFAVLEPFVLTSNVRTMTEQEKYKKAFKTLQAVAKQMSHYGTEDFLEKWKHKKIANTASCGKKNSAKRLCCSTRFVTFMYDSSI